MKCISLSALLIPLTVSVLLSGCVLGERHLTLKIPKGPSASVKGDVAIATVVDSRRFEDKPSDPSTPSVDGKVASKTKSELSQLVGRQRNGYGHAMGGIGLGGGRTMPDVMRELVSEGFSRRGYATKATSQNRVHVDVEKFWAWMTPGMWSLGFEAQIESSLSYKGRNFRVRGAAYNGGQFAKNANWEEAYEMAFEDFLKNLNTELERCAR